MKSHTFSRLLLVAVAMGAGCDVLEPDIQMVEVEVSGRVLIDGAPVSGTPMTLSYMGCGPDDPSCGWNVVMERPSGSDGQYRLRGQVPEEYCAEEAGRVIVGLPPHSELLAHLRWSVFWLPLPACGQNVMDFAFSCPADLSPDAPECVVSER